MLWHSNHTINIKRTLFALLASLSFAVAAALPPADREIELPPYIKLIDIIDEDSINLPDSVFYALSGSVRFQVNKSDLRLDDPFVRDLKRRVLPYLLERDWTLLTIRLRGAASPEGPYDNNVRLARNRASAIANFIAENMGDTYTKALSESTVAEDYKYLVMVMESAGDPDAALVQQAIDECDGNEPAIKQRLMKLEGGKLWAKWLKLYFPELRSARLMIFFKKRKPVEKIETHMVGADLASAWLDMPLAVNDGEPIPHEFSTVIERRHLLSVSSNLLYDGFYMPNYGWAPSPNVGLEFYPKHGNFTFAAEFTFPYWHKWSRNQFFQIRDYHLEVRRYFRPGDYHTGLFLALYANANKYGIGLSKVKGWQGEGIGGAAKIGYVLPLGRHGRWRLEFTAAFGGYYTRFDPYVYGNPISGYEDGDYYYDYVGNPLSFKRRNHMRTWVGPTELGITLRYDLLYRKHDKKGASFRHFEYR